MLSNLTLSIHREESEILAIVPKWLQVFNTTTEHHFIHHPSWFLALQATLCDGNIAICLLEDEQGPLAVLPFVLSKPDPVFRGVTISCPVHDHISLTDWVLGDRITFEDVVKAMPAIAQSLELSGWSTVRGYSVPASSGTLGEKDIAHAESAASHGAVYQSKVGEYLRRTRQSSEIFWFDCLALNEHLRSKLKGNLRRRRKKALALGELSFESVPDDSPKQQDVFDEFLEIEASGWKGGQGEGTAISNSPLLVAFYRHLLQSKIPGMAVDIYMMRVDGRAVAAQFVLRTHKMASLLKHAYDEDYSEVSPSLLLMEDVLNYCAAEKTVESVSLVTSPAWAKPWQPKKMEVFHSAIYNNNFSGYSWALVDSAKDVVRKARTRFMAGK